MFNLLLKVLNHLAIGLCRAVMRLINYEVQFILPFQPRIQGRKISPYAVLARNQDIVLRCDINRAVVSHRPRYNAIGKRARVRNRSRIRIFLKRLRGLLKQGVAMCQPENLFVSINRVLQEPSRSRIGFTASGREHNQSTVLLFRIHDTQILHGLLLMLIKLPRIRTLDRLYCSVCLVFRIAFHLSFPFYFHPHRKTNPSVFFTKTTVQYLYFSTGMTAAPAKGKEQETRKKSQASY